MRVFLLIGTLALFSGCGSKPPEGMRRLDSGDLNWGYRVGERFMNLYYVEGGGVSATRLNVVDLDSGKRKTHRFPGRLIEGVLPGPFENRVSIAAKNTEARPEKAYAFMEVDPVTGRVLSDEPRDDLSPRDLFVSGRDFGGADPFTTAPSSAALADGGSGAVVAEIVKEGRPGVRAALDAGGKRVLRFFPTDSVPDLVRMGDRDEFYASYLDSAAVSVVEAFDFVRGTRRPIARFEGSRVESLAVSGSGVLVLRAGGRGAGPRTLSLVDAAGGRVIRDLPWSDGESSILAVDAGRARMYLTMNEGDSVSCWAVPLGEDALAAASDYLARARGPKVRRFHIGAGADILVMAGMAAAAIFVIVMARHG